MTAVGISRLIDRPLISAIEMHLIFLFLAIAFSLQKRSVVSISCYSCAFNFNDIYDIQDGWCSNDTLYSIAKKEVVRPCSPWETMCSTSVTTILTSFASITRGCAVQCRFGRKHP